MKVSAEACATAAIWARHGEPTAETGHERCPSKLDPLMLTS